MTKSAPAPESATVCGLTGALSVMVTAPERVPPAVGVKVTLMVHVAAGAIAAPVEQVVPVASMAKSPEAAMPVRVKLLLPLLLRVTDWGADVVPGSVLPKVRLEGFSVTPGAVPVPESVTVPEPAFEAMVKLPARAPVVVGVNVTPTVQLALAASAEEMEQVVLAESTAKSPVEVNPEKLMLPAPVFVTVTV